MMLVIRIRGLLAIAADISETMKLMRLNRLNHAMLMTETPSNLGMLRKAKDYITWGEIDAETLELLITRRARLPGDSKVTDKLLSTTTKYKTIKDLSAALLAGDATLEDAGIKPVFRLHPAKKGHEGIKRTFKEGGALGYRGAEINEIAQRMI